MNVLKKIGSNASLPGFSKIIPRGHSALSESDDVSAELGHLFRGRTLDQRSLSVVQLKEKASRESCFDHCCSLFVLPFNFLTFQLLWSVVWKKCSWKLCG